MSILIKDVTIVHMQDESVIEKGCVGIQGNRISYVGSEKPEESYEMIIDGTDKVIMPGLINAHTHIPMSHLRGYSDDTKLENWLYNDIFPFEAKMMPEDIYIGSMLGIVEMIKTGTTCFNDMYMNEAEVARAVSDCGIRANLSQNIFSSGEEEQLKQAKELFEKYNSYGCGLIKINVAPHSVYTCTDETLKRVSNLAKEYGMEIHIHLSETELENEECLKKYGKSPTEQIKDCGIMDVNAVLAHGVYLSDSDCEIIKSKDASVVHDPVSNLKLASGIANVKKLLDSGINVALGTDSVASNNNLDMFEEMKVCALIHKGISKDPTLISAFDVLKIATVNGAKALGREGLGMIKEGYIADLIMLDLSEVYLLPNNNVISNIVYSASGREVCDVIIDGNVAMKDRELVSIDENMVKRNFIKANNRIKFNI